MLLPMYDGLVVTTHFDPEMAALADRHYSRRTVGARQFLYSGRKIVIRDTSGEVLFGWLYRRSSDLILECEAIAVDRWGPNRMYTYVNPAKIASRNPGYCFKMAGWKNVRNPDGSVRVSKTGQHLLEKIP